jgi:L-methionine (R)-S-oxide reductase
MTGNARVLESWLTAFLANAQAVAGTVHLHEGGGLRLYAAVNIPPPVRQAVEWVPNGKGMAGLALERGIPISTCNLREDRTGAVKPGARAVDAKAAVALPVRDSAGTIVAVVGAAFSDERDVEGAELEELQRAADSVRNAFGSDETPDAR